MPALLSSLRQLVKFSWTEYRVCPAFLQDLDTQGVDRLYDFTKAQLILPDRAYGKARNVNSSDQFHLVIESVPPDTKHLWDSSAPARADGAGGSHID